MIFEFFDVFLLHVPANFVIAIFARQPLTVVRGGRRCYFLRFAPPNVPEACKVLSKSLIFWAALDPSWPSRAEAWKIPFRTPVPNLSISYILPL